MEQDNTTTAKNLMHWLKPYIRLQDKIDKHGDNMPDAFDSTKSQRTTWTARWKNMAKERDDLIYEIKREIIKFN